MFFRSNSARRRGARRQPLTIEVLEDRNLPAGNVTTATLGETLRITGDAADNTIQVLQLSPDKYRIIGLGGTTVDGKPEVVAKMRKDLSIDLGAGHDFAFLTAVAVTRDARIANSEDVRILGSTAAGRNLAITVGDSTGDVVGIVIDSTSVGRDLSVTTGDGSSDLATNSVSISSTTVGHDLTVTTGDVTGGLAVAGYIVNIGSTTVGHDLAVTTGNGTGGQ